MYKPSFGSWVLLVSSLFTNSSWSLSAPSCATVTTTSGLITGHVAPNRIDVLEYLGIPYAQPPLGCLRFAAPQKLGSSNALFNASTFSPDCPANIAPPSTFPNFTGNGFRVYSTFTGRAGNKTNRQSEDCLALNVWTKNPSATQAQPVFVWLHGGRFSIPGSHNPFYNGQYLADNEDVVVVTINYRVNIFGFSGTPGEVQNVGLLDQRLAVEWVRDNIQGFGGDPKRITLFGQSAGGASVDYYSYAWTQDPIVSGLISHSGTALSFTPNSPELSAQYFYNVSAALGCGGSGSDSKAVVNCVRSKNTTEILKALALVPAAPSPALPQPVFHPIVDNRTVFADYSALSSKGKFIKVPYLVGNNNYEAGTYKLSAFAARKNLTEAQWDAFNLAGFTCPSAREAAARANNGVPVWRYRYFGDFPNLRLYPGSGAYHGSDLLPIFGTAQDVSGEPNSLTEEATSRYMMNAWASFARDPVAGLSAFGWPVYDPKGDTLVRLAYDNQTTASFVSPDLYDNSCPAVNDPTPAQGAF